MLGTNDTTPYNWIDTKTFFDDYRELISHYKSLKSEPEIILMTPATVFSENLNPEYNYKIRAEITEQIASTMKMFALEEGLPLIDIHEITSKHPEYFKRDGIHPDAFGDALIAEAVYNMPQ